MAYHSDFWLLIGTGAPVVALAHAVAVMPARKEARERADDSLPVRQAGWNARFLLWSPFIIATLGVFGAVDTFALALASTWDETDHSAGLAGFNLVVAVILLAFPAFFDGTRERRLRRYLRRPQA